MMQQSWLYTTFIPYMRYIGWHDITEICIISTVIYLFSVWLHKDRQHNLLGYFYAFCACMLAAHILELTTILSLAPLLTILLCSFLFLVHKQTLQKNYVALRSVGTQPEKTLNTEWIEDLLSTCLVAGAQSQSVLCVIEGTHTLENFITTVLPLQAQINKQLLITLLTSDLYNAQQFIWIHQSGTLKGINCSWITDQSADTALPFEQEAALYTNSTDAVALHYNSKTKEYTLVTGNTCINHLRTDSILTLLTQHLHGAQKEKPVGGKQYEIPRTHTTTQQNRP